MPNAAARPQHAHSLFHAYLLIEQLPDAEPAILTKQRITSEPMPHAEAICAAEDALKAAPAAAGFSLEAAR